MTYWNDTETKLFYHGTKAHLETGGLIAPGYASNFGRRRISTWVYFTGTLDAAIWGAELAEGGGRERIYIVEPTGECFDDPNLTDQKYPGNPTLSYRSRSPLRVIGEVERWHGHSPERLAQMREHVRLARERGFEALD